MSQHLPSRGHLSKGQQNILLVPNILRTNWGVVYCLCLIVSEKYWAMTSNNPPPLSFSLSLTHMLLNKVSSLSRQLLRDIIYWSHMFAGWWIWVFTKEFLSHVHWFFLLIFVIQSEAGYRYPQGSLWFSWEIHFIGDAFLSSLSG